MGKIQDNQDGYSDQEAQERFEAALRAGLKTPAQPLKNKPKVRAAKKPVRPSKSDA